MNKKPLQVGDRVRVYGGYDSGGRYYYCHGGKATVTDITLDTEVTVRFDTMPGYVSSNVTTIVHPKQCRRLKKKEPRVIWANFFSTGVIAFTSEAAANADALSTDHEVAVRFIEAPRGKKKS